MKRTYTKQVYLDSVVIESFFLRAHAEHCDRVSVETREKSESDEEALCRFEVFDLMVTNYRICNNQSFQIIIIIQSN